MGDFARVGQTNGRAKLTDREAEIIRQMYEPRVVGYRQLGRIFEVHWVTIRDIVKERRR